jgi:hypothetical protein
MIRLDLTLPLERFELRVRAEVGRAVAVLACRA